MLVIGLAFLSHKLDTSVLIGRNGRKGSLLALTPLYSKKVGAFQMSYEFDFAISFSGECRTQAEELAELLVAKGATVFYDNFFRAHLLGKRLDDEFSQVFGPKTRFFVPFVSAAYAQKSWPQHEWSTARREAEKRPEEFILPLRVDDSLLVGLPDTVSYLDLRRTGLKEVADLLFQKLERSTEQDVRFRGTQDLVATFGLSMDDVRGEELPPEAPSEAVRLYDWLTDELRNRLDQTPLAPVRVVEDLRTGETLSVRLVFAWDPSKGALDFGDMGWWELLELVPFEDLHGEDGVG